MLGSLNAAKEVSYLTLFPAQNATTATNSAGVAVNALEGTLAIIVTSGSGSGTTPVYTTYFQTSADTNIANATNVQITLNGANVSTVVTNATNIVQVFELQQRACSKYLFAVGAISGVNANVPISIVVAGGPKYTA